MYKIPATTLFVGKNLIFMPECHSTNDAMLLLCQNEPAPEGTVIVTANQTSGRGQRGNSWEAEPGKNLTFTLLVKPSFLPIDQQFYLNVFTSLAIRDYLTRRTDKKVQIKWPNDILIEGKKVCGVLIENQLSGKSIASSIVGIGLNINQLNFNVSTATSLSAQTGRSFELSEELDALLSHIEKRYLQLRSSSLQHLKSDYLTSLYLLDEQHTFEDANGPFSARITGIDSIGRLVVDRDGSDAIYDLKEIRY